jgi:hypothetical protein
VGTPLASVSPQGGSVPTQAVVLLESVNMTRAAASSSRITHLLIDERFR